MPSKARPKRPLYLLFILILVALSCQTFLPTPTAVPTQTPTFTPSPTPTPTELPPTHQELLDLLAYVPYGIADIHYPVFGPVLVYKDYARMRSELGIPASLSGASTHKEKLPLLTGIEDQGFGDIAESSDAFDEWGWDIADVDQSLYIFTLDIQIYKGRFSRPEIRDKLLEKGYSSEPVGDFTVFIPETAPTAYAWKEDTIIIGGYVLEEEQDFVKEIAAFPSTGEPNMGSHPSFAAMPPFFQKAWGILLAPSPDLPELQEENEKALNILPQGTTNFYLSNRRTGEIQPAAWDFMALNFRPDGEQFSVRLIYHYPTRESAEANVRVVETTLVETPSLGVRNMFWGDMLPVDEIGVQETFVIVDAHTQMISLVGNAVINDLDYWGLLPADYK